MITSGAAYAIALFTFVLALSMRFGAVPAQSRPTPRPNVGLQPYYESG